MKRTFNSIASIVLALFMLSGQVFASSQSDLPALDTLSSIQASSYVLMDADHGRILKASAENRSMPMASTTKIMTCLLALEEKTLSDQVVIPKEAVGVEGSSVYLSKGETLTLEDLLYALMLESANDAAVAIAVFVGGDLQNFVERMNQKASELGMTSTRYKNPHGLPADGHFSSAHDLAKLMKYALQNEAFCQITQTKSHQIPAPDSSYRYLSNHNKLLRLYENCIGGKTGFTREAGRCLVSAARRDGKTLVCVTLGAPNDWQNHMDLFEYGFSLYAMRPIAGKGELVRSVPVLGGVKDSISVTNLDAVSLPLLESDEIQIEYELPLFCFASIKEGEYLGDAVVKIYDRECERIPLFASEGVDARVETLSFFQRIIQNLKLWFK